MSCGVRSRGFSRAGGCGALRAAAPAAWKLRVARARRPSGASIARARAETPRRRGGKNTRRISATSVEVETRRGLGDAPASALGGEMALAATAFPRPSLLEASCGFSARLEGEMELLAAAQRTPAARLWIRGGGADKEFVRAGRVVSAGWRGLAGARRVRRE